MFQFNLLYVKITVWAPFVLQKLSIERFMVVINEIAMSQKMHDLVKHSILSVYISDF